jgi:hypothetical protein
MYGLWIVIVYSLDRPQRIDSMHKAYGCPLELFPTKVLFICVGLYPKSLQLIKIYIN